MSIASLFTNYAADIINNYWLRNTAGTPPATVYLALFTTDPGPAGVMTGELAFSGGYSRLAITFGTASASGMCHNTADVILTATADWQPVVAIGIVDNSGSQGGHVISRALLGAPIVILNTQVMRFVAGSIVQTP